MRTRSAGEKVGRVLSLLVAMAVVATGVYIAGNRPGANGDGAGSGGEVFLEAAAAPGPNPFMPSVAEISEAATTTAPSTTTTEPTESTATTDDATTTTGDGDGDGNGGALDGLALVVQAIDAATPGLYGGTRDQSSCDVAQMITFLESDDAKQAAWAGVQGIGADQVTTYLEGLTPVNLRADTRVTNHGYTSGTANARQAVLEAGTAVLVDDLGVPRAKCACGNPLTPPTPVNGTPTLTGEPWPAFDPANVVSVQPAPKPIADFTLVDPVGKPFTRPAASTGTKDADPKPGVAQTVTTALRPTTTAGPGPTIEPIGPSTPPRSVEASSVFSDEFPTSLAIDGDPTTSWFSSGPTDDGTTTFTWHAPAPGRVMSVAITPNSENANPDFREGYGFESVELQVLDEAGEAVFTNTVSLAGTPDPPIVVRPDFEGASVRLVFSGSEDPECGGFADIAVVMA